MNINFNFGLETEETNAIIGMIEKIAIKAIDYEIAETQRNHNKNNNNNYNHNKNNNRKNERATYIKPDAPESVEMRVNKLMLSKPEAIENVGFHKWEFNDKESNNRVTFELSITEILDISIKGNGTMVWIHVYGTNTKISGLDFGSLPLFLDKAGFPADVKNFIMKAVEI